MIADGRWGLFESDVANVSAARDIYQRGVWASRDQRGASSLWTSWALLEERAGKPGQARLYLREAVRRDRFAVDVRMVWAGLEARAGDVSAARELFEGAVVIDDRNVVVWDAYEDMERAKGFTIAANRVAERAEAARLAQPITLLGAAGSTASPSAGGAGGGGIAGLPSKALVAAAYAAEEWIVQQQAPSESGVQQAYGQAPGAAAPAR